MHVESIRPYAGQIDPHRELELLDALATKPEPSGQVLADGVARIFRAGWALVLDAAGRRRSAVIGRQRGRPGTRPRSRRRGGRRPRPGRSTPTRTGRRATGTAVGTELAVAPLGDGALLRRAARRCAGCRPS